ncbi:TnsA endonuclease N-terminal domain-containing protein [Devosia sp.]|uniref:TnsA endonuclease N-terminal domain-containing protein n=1 Tax=Devosia sp. TaxID=1871048 RepID=UPI0025F60C55|nr:TnsA endonuclease N-terminal domain-containing protein [Devosia sp.]MCR6634762.1 hypothetical protein [Devosia sp.]
MPVLASKAFANIFDENGARIYFNGKVETARRQKRKGAILRGTELREVRIRGKDIYTGLMPLTLRGADGNIQNKMLGFESLTEGDFWSVVNFSEEQLTTAYAQPAKLPIFMFGRQRHWIPDGLLEFQNGKRRLVEVKPLEVVAIDPTRDPERSRWVAEWYGAIKQAAETSGFEFELYTDKRNPI